MMHVDLDWNAPDLPESSYVFALTIDSGGLHVLFDRLRGVLPARFYFTLMALSRCHKLGRSSS
jgi:hypothetical protein